MRTKGIGETSAEYGVGWEREGSRAGGGGGAEIAGPGAGV